MFQAAIRRQQGRVLGQQCSYPYTEVASYLQAGGNPAAVAYGAGSKDDQQLINYLLQTQSQYKESIRWQALRGWVSSITNPGLLAQVGRLRKNALIWGMVDNGRPELLQALTKMFYGHLSPTESQQLMAMDLLRTQRLDLLKTLVPDLDFLSKFDCILLAQDWSQIEHALNQQTYHPYEERNIAYCSLPIIQQYLTFKRARGESTDDLLNHILGTLMLEYRYNDLEQCTLRPADMTSLQQTAWLVGDKDIIAWVESSQLDNNIHKLSSDDLTSQHITTTSQ